MTLVRSGAESALLAMAGDQGNINANTVVLLRDDPVGSFNGGLTWNNGTNRATLKKGKTYKLQAYCRHFGNPGNTAANYSWFDITNGVFIGRPNQIDSLDSLTADGQQTDTTVIVEPVTDIDVELRCVSVSAANQGLRADATHAVIETL